MSIKSPELIIMFYLTKYRFNINSALSTKFYALF